MDFRGFFDGFNWSTQVENLLAAVFQRQKLPLPDKDRWSLSLIQVEVEVEQCGDGT